MKYFWLTRRGKINHITEKQVFAWDTAGDRTKFLIGISNGAINLWKGPTFIHLEPKQAQALRSVLAALLDGRENVIVPIDNHKPQGFWRWLLG